jgi:hypothetical protein
MMVGGRWQVPTPGGKWPVSVETCLAKPNARVQASRTAATVAVMAGKKQNDATQNLPPDEPTQVLPKGTKTGLPTRKQVELALAKVAKKPT